MYAIPIIINSIIIFNLIVNDFDNQRWLNNNYMIYITCYICILKREVFLLQL